MMPIQIIDVSFNGSARLRRHEIRLISTRKNGESNIWSGTGPNPILQRHIIATANRGIGGARKSFGSCNSLAVANSFRIIRIREPIREDAKDIDVRSVYGRGE